MFGGGGGGVLGTPAHCWRRGWRCCHSRSIIPEGPGEGELVATVLAAKVTMEGNHAADTCGTCVVLGKSNHK